MTLRTSEGGNRQPKLPPSKELFTKAVPGLADLVTFREYQVPDRELS
jgi:hypothetical protein